MGPSLKPWVLSAVNTRINISGCSENHERSEALCKFCCHVKSTKSINCYLERVWNMQCQQKSWQLINDCVLQTLFWHSCLNLGCSFREILLFVSHKITWYYSIFRQLVWIHLVSHSFYKVLACPSINLFFLARRSISHKKAKERKNAMAKYPSQSLPSLHLLVQNQRRKHRSNVWNLLVVNIKDIRTTSLTSF